MAKVNQLISSFLLKEGISYLEKILSIIYLKY